MQPIIYDVAVSIDGFICGPGGDISAFAQEGPVVEAYMDRLAGYRIAIMGRATYEFGYAFGLRPGANPYPNMRTIVFSDTLDLPRGSEVTRRARRDTAALGDLKAEAEGPIYLCGGGAFAGSLLATGLIDRLRLKRAPAILGAGIRLFGDASRAPGLHHVATQPHDGGYLFQEFAIGP